jgi:hypothetical protein
VSRVHRVLYLAPLRHIRTSNSSSLAHLLKQLPHELVRWSFTESCNYVGIAFWPPLSAPTCGKYNGVAIDLIQVHCWITQREELVPGLESGKPGYLLACLQSTKESFHGLIKTKKHFMQELPLYVL